MQKKSFLFCHPGALGDFILTWPVLTAMRQIMPEYEFTAIGQLPYLQIAQRLNLLDHPHDVNARYLADFFSGERFPPQLGKPAGAILWLTHSEEMRNLLQSVVEQPIITLSPRPAIQNHISIYYLQQVQHYYPITFSNSIISEIEFPLQNKNGNLVLIHPGSGSSKKIFSTTFYRTLFELFKDRGFSNVAILLGPAEIERNLSEELKSTSFLFSENLDTLLSIFQTTALFIGNDSGVSHLAGIFGIPSIVLYKSTNPAVWGVMGKRVHLISGKQEKEVLNKIKNILESQKIP